MPIGWKLAQVFPHCYFEPSWKTRMWSVELSSWRWHWTIFLCWLPSHHYHFHDDFQSSQLSPCWSAQHSSWLPVITIVPMMTSSLHYSFHGDFQWSQLGPHWSNICADYQSSLPFPWWLPVITTNAVWGVPCEQISMQWLAVTKHSCWLEVIELLGHVWITISHAGVRGKYKHVDLAKITPISFGQDVKSETHNTRCYELLLKVMPLLTQLFQNTRRIHYTYPHGKAQCSNTSRQIPEASRKQSCIWLAGIASCVWQTRPQSCKCHSLEFLSCTFV